MSDIFSSIDVNLEYIKNKFNSLINSDVAIREFTFVAQNRQFKAFLLYIDGLVDNAIVNDFIVKPLTFNNNIEKENGSVVSQVVSNISIRKVRKFNLEEHIYKCLLPQNNIKKFSTLEEITNEVCSGNCAIFIDTLTDCFSLDVSSCKPYPVLNSSLFTPYEKFCTLLNNNTCMLRKYINNENLIIESSNVGTITKTKIAICYMKDVVDNHKLAKVKEKINILDIDFLLSSRSIKRKS